MNNPFFYGPPVQSDRFIGRRREWRHVVGRILNGGQSTALIGEPRSGKTSLLAYLAAMENRVALYGEGGAALDFAFLDMHALGDSCGAREFWGRALTPLIEARRLPDAATPLGEAYRLCLVNGFGTFVLERFFVQLRHAGGRLVLCLDEFDVLLHHPCLGGAEFFGSLRSLTSRSEGALALVVAGRRPLERLNGETQQYSRNGSPYFNFLSEMTLGPLAHKDAADLLARGGARFSPADRAFVAALAGEHPYLLQVGASALWEADDAGLIGPARLRQAEDALYAQARQTLSDTWQNWAPETRCAFIAAGLDQINADTLGGRTFSERRLLRDLRDFGPELRHLEKQGFLVETAPGEWRVRPQIFLRWLADEIVRMTRAAPDPAAWLSAQGWEGLLTHEEKARLSKVLRAAGKTLEGSIQTLLDARVKKAVGG